MSARGASGRIKNLILTLGRNKARRRSSQKNQIHRRILKKWECDENESGVNEKSQKKRKWIRG